MATTRKEQALLRIKKAELRLAAAERTAQEIAQESAHALNRADAYSALVKLGFSITFVIAPIYRDFISRGDKTICIMIDVS